MPRCRPDSGESRSARPYGISAFVAEAFAKHGIKPPGLALDLPCGFGRHSNWLAECGFSVVAADVDRERILTFAQLRDGMPSHGIHGIQLNANLPLPFNKEVFDLAIVVDFVCQPLLQGIATYIRQGGLLIFETMSVRGQNWLDLPRPDETYQLLKVDFDILELAAVPAGPTKTEAEKVKLVAKRR